ncbi:hypothetical protein T11_7583 [Trichinella zimbabwensis]|uniref:PiggyBac transposable element-derived protein domain-containing protein n=1 Tax=Trichinella zimbabwensis TaxID=268475 RepID=A0A0V1I7Z6_9BILA|nr:hypothetical protein T11_7583 [Trichinella zimbabwensis]
MHNDIEVSDGKSSKPDIKLHYNNTKGGVDNLDKMIISTYSCQRMTARWPLVIFYNMIDQLSKALVQPEMMRRKTLTAQRTAAAKSAIEKLRKEAEQPSTSISTDTDRSGKKGARCQLCVSRDNKTSMKFKFVSTYIHYIRRLCDRGMVKKE